MSRNKIITFNVGGKHYDISRSLLELYPNTVLATAASETWNNHGDNNNNNCEPIFIERDGKRFRYILDYMRDGKVHLPANIPKQAFICDLDYLGFHNLSIDSIQIHSNELNNPFCPEDLKYEHGIQFHQITWDVTRANSNMKFENKNHLVRQKIGNGEIVFGRIGFTSGVHFWNVKILEGSCTVGVVSDEEPIKVLIHKLNGMGVFRFKTDDVVGTLLNMNQKSVTFYINGHRLSTRDITCGVYYPCALLNGYNAIVSCEIPSEKKVFLFLKEETWYDSVRIPKELKFGIDVECHEISWNPLRCSQDLVVTNHQHSVKRNTATGLEWQAILGLQGFTHGVHFWNIHIKTFEANAHARIGVSSNLDFTQSYYAGKEDNGGSYCGTDGKYYCHYLPLPDNRRGNNNISVIGYGPTFTNDDIIGTLLDMTHKTVTFYKNGIRCGPAIGKKFIKINNESNRPLLSGDIFYPCVAFGPYHHQEIISCEISH